MRGCRLPIIALAASFAVPFALKGAVKGVVTTVGLLVGAAVAPGCNLDTDRAAPPVAPPTEAGVCGTTESLFPKLLAFVREERFAPIRQVIETRLLPTEADPTPDLSLRTLLSSLVSLIEALGLDRTALVADYLERGNIEEQLAPLFVTLLKFVDGQTGNPPHYAAGDAAAVFVRTCNPDFLLEALERILRLESPSHGERWLLAVLRELGPLVGDPALRPFLDTFERESQTGRPAVVALLAQIMLLVADENFQFRRIEVLLESVVYPIAPPNLRRPIDALVTLLREATDPSANVLVPLQGSLRCGLAHPAERDELLGLVFDVVVARELGLDRIIDSTLSVIDQERARAELDLFADLIAVIVEDEAISDDLRALIALFLSQPDSQLALPVFIDLLERGVVIELFQAMVTLLGGCERDVVSM